MQIMLKMAILGTNISVLQNILSNYRFFFHEGLILKYISSCKRISVKIFKNEFIAKDLIHFSKCCFQFIPHALCKFSIFKDN